MIAGVIPARVVRGLRALALGGVVACAGGSDASRSAEATADADTVTSPVFRNVAARTAYVGDATCAGCHANEARAYAGNSMARSFHRWSDSVRVETPLDSGLVHARTGFRYAVEERADGLYQVEFLLAGDGRRFHELRRRIDYVMGSGRLARTYFTSENGRLFQLPLTWYRRHGWDFSPGYERVNGRFDRQLPDRCIACHSSYPTALPHLEGKYAALPPGIGCERCHGPGALHARERAAGPRVGGAFDASIVNPARLPVERRLDTCEQCHVHTDVAVPRPGRSAFDFIPSERLADQYAFFKSAGGIDVVSHADRLRQSACFLATRRTPKPLECATCHAPHPTTPAAVAAAARPNDACLGCHAPAALAKAVSLDSRPAHTAGANCVTCHMPDVAERAVPHGTFTDHWIRVPERDAAAPRAPERGRADVQAYFARDRAGDAGAVTRAMGAVMDATLAGDARALGAGATALRSALERDSTRADAFFLLGVAYQQLDAAEQSIAPLERALRLDADQPEALRALARAWAHAGRASADVDSLYRSALALQPALAWMRVERADLLAASGRRAHAIAEYRAALAEHPSLAIGWFNLGATLVSGGERAPASDAFSRAVRLDPALGEALSSLVEVRTRADTIVGVRGLGSPLPALPVRDRGPAALQLAFGGIAASRSIEVLNVPVNGVVQIQRPDGSVVRTLSVGPARSVSWDLLTAAGSPIAGGLHRIRVLGRDGSGRPLPPRLLAFGVVRVHE